MSKVDAARARWRADLHDFGSSGLRSAGLVDMAIEHENEAARNRAYADLMDELADAKEEGNRVILKDVKQRVAAYRLAERSSSHARPGVLNNILEPSDSELIELGY